jgi:hypothetical protein
MDKIVEIICRDYFLDLEFIMLKLGIDDEEVLQALLDVGTISPEDLTELIDAEENEETFE